MHFIKVDIDTAFDLAEPALPQLGRALLALGDHNPDVVFIYEKVSGRRHKRVDDVALDENALLVHFPRRALHH